MKYNTDHTTTIAVAAYKATNNVFHGLLKEVRELSKKKPEATLSAGKVKVINRILIDMKEFLIDEPEGKYLDLLGDEELPQQSDAVLVMVQFEAAMDMFASRYQDYATLTGWKINDD